MPWYVYVLQFVSGLLLANGVPHFVQGVSGHRFQSPFASPPGVGESSPLVNVLWGFANLAAGFAIFWSFQPKGADVVLPMGRGRPRSAGDGHHARAAFRTGQVGRAIVGQALSLPPLRAQGGQKGRMRGFAGVGVGF